MTPLYDRVPVGKSLQAGIESAFDDKFGERRPATFRTSALVKIMHEGEIISNMNALVYEISLEDANLPLTSRNGEAFMTKLDDVDGLMGGVKEFLQTLETVESPFDSEWYY